MPQAESGERMDETHLSAFHPVSNRAHGKRLRNCRLYLPEFFFLSHARDNDFDLYDHVERVTAHRFKIIDNS